MISISYEIPPITFAHNPIWLFLKSDNFKVSNGNYAQNWFIISSTTNYPVYGTVAFKVLAKTLGFTFKATPNNSGYELPTRLVGESNTVYANRVVVVLKKNYYLHGNFDITTSVSGANAVIIFSAREFGIQYNFTNINHTGVLPSQAFTFSLAGAGSLPMYRPNFKILLQIISGGRLLNEEYLTVDELGFVKVDLREYFDFNSELGFPSSVPLVQNYSAIQDLSFGVAEIYGNPVSVYDFTLYEGYKVIPGAYLEADFRTIYQSYSTTWATYRLNHIPQNKFMTSHKGQKETFKKSFEKLTFLAYGDVSVEVNVNYTDGTNAIQGLGGIIAATPQIWEINCSINTLALEIIQPAKTISSYDVRILNSSSVILSSFTFIYNNDKPLYFNQYAFIGRNGNWEFLTTIGGQTVGAKPDFSYYIPVSANDVFTNDITAKVKQSETRQSVVGRTGYVDVDALELLSDFFESQKVYEIIEGKLFAISDIMGYPSIDENTDVENIFAFEFNYTRERLPMRNILCNDQLQITSNTMPNAQVECWGHLPPIATTSPLQTEGGSNLLTEDLLTLDTE